MKEWSEHNRNRQSEAIKKYKPWEKSTGPNTNAGKERSAMNANKGKSPLRAIQKMITKIHKERLELLEWLKNEFGIKIVL